MSLKAFHIFFIGVAILFSFGFAAWCFREGMTESAGAGALGTISAALGVALLIYMRWFAKRPNGA